MNLNDTKPDSGQLIGFKFGLWSYPGNFKGQFGERELVTWPDGRKSYASTHEGRYFKGRGVWSRSVMEPPPSIPELLSVGKLCCWSSVMEWWPIGEEEDA